MWVGVGGCVAPFRLLFGLLARDMVRDVRDVREGFSLWLPPWLPCHQAGGWRGLWRAGNTIWAKREGSDLATVCVLGNIVDKSNGMSFLEANNFRHL